MRKLTPSAPCERWMEKFCPYCNARLSLREQLRKKHSIKILCRRCGKSIAGDMTLIGNTKFPKEMIRKRF